MALFGNSTTINEIHRKAGYIIENLRKIETTLISSGGATYSNTETLNNYMYAGRSHNQTLQSLLSRISDREYRQLSLCWMDGNYLPLT
jgi:hypothetical protein